MDVPIIFTADAGRVFYRGVYRDPEDAALLLAQFRRKGLAGDWFNPFAAAFADQLEAAMQAAGYLRTQEKAA